MHKYHKCCSELIWLFYGLLQQLWGKTSIISYLRDFSAQVSQFVFSAHFNRFPASYNCMSEKFKSLISPWAKCTSATNRVLSSFDRFTAYYKCMRKNFKNLISPWVQCTSIKNRALSSLDRFTPYYNCMKKNLKNFISPWVQCTSITNPFFGSFDRFTSSYNCKS